MHKDQIAIIPVTRDKNSSLLTCGFQQILILGAGQAQFGCSRHVIFLLTKKMLHEGVHILVKQKLHAATEEM